MSIQVLYGKFKTLAFREDVLISLLIVTVSISSFYLGRLSNPPASNLDQQVGAGAVSTYKKRAPVDEKDIVTLPVTEEKETLVPQKTEKAEGGYVASKSGTKYHLPWCGSAKQIKEENKIWFATKAEAEAAGYTPAANCKGI